MPLRAVLFDFGHTLVDFHRTQDALLAAYEQVRARIEAALNIDAPEVGHLIDRVANEADRLVALSYAQGRLEELDIVQVFDEVLLTTLGLTVPPDVVSHIVSLDHSAYSNTLTVSEETLETLARLKERGLLLGLVSNVALLPHLMRADLESLGIMAYMDATTFSSEVGTRKPDPRIFRKVLDEIEVDPADAVFVGDRLRDDVAGAQSVGMRGVLTREFRQEPDVPDIRPDAVIERFPELPGALDRLGASVGVRGPEHHDEQ
ncbi:MAG: HAD family hydrolase [Actinomycetota bacterium]|nr:HAD family hydrolase [Actinomycetota bacterium]